MAKKKEVSVDAVDVPNTGLLNPQVTAPVSTNPDEIVIVEVDFNELLELEKATRQTEEQLNKIAGSIYRLNKDMDVYHNHEKTLNEQINVKRKDLIRRYKIDETRQWRIDLSSRKVVYQS